MNTDHLPVIAQIWLVFQIKTSVANKLMKIANLFIRPSIVNIYSESIKGREKKKPFKI